MVDSSKNKLLLLQYSLFLYFILFFLNLVYMNIMIERPQGIFLSDILLWIQLIFVMVSYFYLKAFQKNKTTFVVSIYKKIVFGFLLLLIIYFISVYLQSYLLIDETLVIIRDKILRGNSALILNFSNVNYTTLSYVVGLLQSMNSPLIILFMALWTMRFYYRADHVDTILETSKRYDDFVYTLFIPLFWFIVMISSFLSINLLTLEYTWQESIEMLLSIPLFMMAMIGWLVSLKWYQTKNKSITPSEMTSAHRFLFFILKPMFIFSIGLLLYHIFTGYQTYRIYASYVAIGCIMILFLLHFRLRKLD